MTTATIAIALLLLAGAVMVIVLTPPARRTVRPRRHGGPRATGLPAGQIVYSDAEGTAAPLVARRYALSGKPDYVVLTPEGWRVPVEIKSARVRHAPRHEDVLQLVTYMLILDDLYEHEPPPRYGLLRYADATFEVPYTAELRAEVLALLAEIQELDGDEPPSGDPDVARCRSCAFKAICPDAAL